MSMRVYGSLNKCDRATGKNIDIGSNICVFCMFMLYYNVVKQVKKSVAPLSTGRFPSQQRRHKRDTEKEDILGSRKDAEIIG